MSLGNNRIGDEGVKALTEAVKKAKQPISLFFDDIPELKSSFGSNKIGVKTAAVLRDALKKNNAKFGMPN